MVICGRWLILMVCPIWQKSQCEDPSLSQYKTVQREVPQGIVLCFFIVNISLNNLFLLVIVGQIVEFAAYSQFLRATGLSERKQMSQDLRLHSILSNQLCSFQCSEYETMYLIFQKFYSTRQRKNLSSFRDLTRDTEAVTLELKFCPPTKIERNISLSLFALS